MHKYKTTIVLHCLLRGSKRNNKVKWTSIVTKELPESWPDFKQPCLLDQNQFCLSPDLEGVPHSGGAFSCDFLNRLAAKRLLVSRMKVDTCFLMAKGS